MFSLHCVPADFNVWSEDLIQISNLGLISDEVDSRVHCLHHDYTMSVVSQQLIEVQDLRLELLLVQTSQCSLALSICDLRSCTVSLPNRDAQRTAIFSNNISI